MVNANSGKTTNWHPRELACLIISISLFTQLSRVSKGRIDLQTFVAQTSTNAARLFGIYPKKGTISIGADADICIWDAEKEVTITQDILHHDTDYTPYEGLQVQGWPAATISRGKLVWNNGEEICEPGWGKFLARDPYDYIKPRGVLPTPFDPVFMKTDDEV